MLWAVLETNGDTSRYVASNKVIDTISTKTIHAIWRLIIKHIPYRNPEIYILISTKRVTHACCVQPVVINSGNIIESIGDILRLDGAGHVRSLPVEAPVPHQVCQAHVDARIGVANEASYVIDIAFYTSNRELVFLDVEGTAIKTEGTWHNRQVEVIAEIKLIRLEDTESRVSLTGQEVIYLEVPVSAEAVTRR